LKSQQNENIPRPVGETSLKEEKLQIDQNQPNAMVIFITFRNHRQQILMLFHIYNGNGNGLLFHMTQPISRSTIKAIA